ncbi:MAG: MFS transporter [Cryobacterium sp.]|nr:MFS transporter [Cryobacterium sp.]
MSTIDHQVSADYRSGRRKAYRRLVPLMMAVYFMAFIDRSNLGMAKNSLEADIGIGAAAYGLGAGIFFLSYALLEVPSNLVLHRVGARWWIARIAVTWGAISSAMMFVTNEWSFYLLRFLLGAAEAGLYTGLLFLVTIWLDQKDRPKVIGYLLVASSMAVVLGSPLGGTLMLMEGIGGLYGWQWMFLVEGIPSIALGVVIWFLLPNRPAEAVWLSEREARAMTEAAADVGGEEHISGGLSAGFRNPLIICIALIYFLNQIATYGAIYFSPSVVESLGVTGSFRIGVVAGLIGIGAALGALLVPRMLRREEGEIPVITFCIIGASLGGVAFLALDEPLLKLLSLAAALFFITGVLPMFWSVAMGRISGRMAAGVLAFVNTIGLCGGFVGPYLFGLVEDWTGSAEGGFYVLLVALLVSLLLVPLASAARRRAPRTTAVEEMHATST